MTSGGFDAVLCGDCCSEQSTFGAGTVGLGSGALWKSDGDGIRIVSAMLREVEEKIVSVGQHECCGNGQLQHLPSVMKISVPSVMAGFRQE